ncbi:MAG: hypothetical protein ACXU8U_03105 [Asticcacaulis sp.]
MTAWLFAAAILMMALWVRRSKNMTGRPARWLPVLTPRRLIAVLLLIAAAIAILPIFPAEFGLIASIDWAIYADVLIAIAAIAPRIAWRSLIAETGKAWRWLAMKTKTGRRRAMPRAVRIRRPRLSRKPTDDADPASGFAVA